MKKYDLIVAWVWTALLLFVSFLWIRAYGRALGREAEAARAAQAARSVQ